MHHLLDCFILFVNTIVLDRPPIWWALPAPDLPISLYSAWPCLCLLPAWICLPDFLIPDLWTLDELDHFSEGILSCWSLHPAAWSSVLYPGKRFVFSKVPSSVTPQCLCAPFGSFLVKVLGFPNFYHSWMMDVNMLSGSFFKKKNCLVFMIVWYNILSHVLWQFFFLVWIMPFHVCHGKTNSKDHCKELPLKYRYRSSCWLYFVKCSGLFQLHS